ncbi:MAG: hypothetical protein QHH06_01510 [Clostridiales bacterium]|jgi:hypothetical protein|nr:hypothetical protein [Eubacteriales bacterium]MDH7565146.1 hypothetical protein [Clostridiales bacterium]
MDTKHEDFESYFDISQVSFKNVSSEFERKFRERYNNSLKLMSNKKDRLSKSSGANSMSILEKMARQIHYYDSESVFEASYKEILDEYEPFTET